MQHVSRESLQPCIPQVNSIQIYVLLAYQRLGILKHTP